MKAVVVEEPGPPQVLGLRNRPIRTPEPGWVLIEVKAFGLNRSEIFTRLGHFPTVKLPRILGIEAVGVVASAPGGDQIRSGLGSQRLKGQVTAPFEQKIDFIGLCRAMLRVAETEAYPTGRGAPYQFRIVWFAPPLRLIPKAPLG